jgi:CBS domain-containing protein
MEAPSARIGEDAVAARARVAEAGFETLVVVDDDRRPLGYLSLDALGTDRVQTARMTSIDAVGKPDMPLREALSLMLSQTGSHLLVVGDDGRVAGYVSADLISAVLAGTADAAAEPVGPTERSEVSG